MVITRLEKVNNPLPWILGVMAGGILLVGASTYMIVRTPNSVMELEAMTVPVKKQSLTVEIKASGTVEPIQSVNISPKSPGRLLKLLVEQGSVVKEGQTLAVMENAEIQARGFEAEANLRGAIAALKEAEINLTGEINQAQTRLIQAQARLQEAQQRIPKQIEQARAQLRSAESRFQLAEERVKRNQYLVSQGAVAQDNYDEALNEYQGAQARIAETIQYLEQLKNTENPEIEQLKAAIAETKIEVEQKKGSAQAEIARLKAAVEAAQAQLEVVKVQYRDTIITAPFAGIISQKYATEGAFVTPTTSASTTASATSASILALAKGLEIVAKVPEVDLGQLKIGQPVQILADAYPEQLFQGRVKKIAPEAIVEQNVTSFEVTIELLSGQAQLMSKMNVDVTFFGGQISDTLVIPTVAIVTQEGKTGVMVIDENNKPKFQPVTIGLTIKDKTQILDGLSTEERVFIVMDNDS